MNKNTNITAKEEVHGNSTSQFFYVLKFPVSDSNTKHLAALPQSAALSLSPRTDFHLQNLHLQIITKYLCKTITSSEFMKLKKYPHSTKQ